MLIFNEFFIDFELAQNPLYHTTEDVDAKVCVEVAHVGGG